MRKQEVYYVGSAEDVSHHAQPLAGEMDLRIVDSEEVVRFALSGDLCIFFNEFFAHFREACRALRRRGCPTIYAIDGILEWRSAWEGGSNPEVMRPVLCHKAATIGRSQARILESWGNLGKCEVVGIPRLDAMLGREPRIRRPNEPFRVLIMTAKAPGFTSGQIDRARDSLLDLKRWLEQHPRLGEVPLQPIWRITADMDKEIDVRNDLKDLAGADLAEMLQRIDGVITTPSTAMLEAMLQGIPVALLDYNNCPHYVPAAWTITAPQHLDQIIPELVDPPAAKMSYQDAILHDALECRTPATLRMVRLIEKMIRISHDCRSRNQPLRFPRRILPDETDSHHLPEQRSDRHTPDAQPPGSSAMDRAALQAEVGNLEVLIRTLELENTALQQQEAVLRRSLDQFQTHPVLGRLLRARRKVLGLRRRITQAERT